MTNERRKNILLQIQSFVENSWKKENHNKRRGKGIDFKRKEERGNESEGCEVSRK